MEILTGIGEFLGKITPLIAAILLYLIPTAKDRLERRDKKNTPTPPVQQGQTVDYTRDYVEMLKKEIADAQEMARLKALLDQHGIPYDTDGKEEP